MRKTWVLPLGFLCVSAVAQTPPPPPPPNPTEGTVVVEDDSYVAVCASEISDDGTKQASVKSLNISGTELIKTAGTTGGNPTPPPPDDPTWGPWEFKGTWGGGPQIQQKSLPVMQEEQIQKISK